MSANAEIARLQALAAGKVGGKGSVRRPAKAVHRVAVTEDRQLMANLRRFGVGPIGEVEEVNFFLDDGKVLSFEQPKMHAAVQSGIYVVSGNHVVKRAEDIKAVNPTQVLQQLLAASKGLSGLPTMDA